MKKFFLPLLASLALASCSVSDDPGTLVYASTIEDVTMPAKFKVDSTSHVMIRYKRPTDCHIFNGFFTDGSQFVRNYAVRFVKMDDSNCATDETIYEIPLNFTPAASGTYMLRFWNSRDSNGVDTYIEREAIVP